MDAINNFRKGGKKIIMNIKKLRERVERTSSITKIGVFLAYISIMQRVIAYAFSSAGGITEFWHQILRGDGICIIFLILIIDMFIITFAIIYIFWGVSINPSYICYKIKKIDKIIDIGEIINKIINYYDDQRMTISNFEELLGEELDKKICDTIKDLYGDRIYDKCLPSYNIEKIKKEIKKRLKIEYIPKERVCHWRYWSNKEEVI